jgi:hypothetical protein
VYAVKDEERCIRLGAGEAEGGDKSREPMIPGARGLLQPVERPVEAAHMTGAGRVNEPGGLMTKDHLGELPMEEGILHIKLTNLPVGGEGDGENSPDGGGFYHRTKGLIEVDTVLL